MSWEYAEIKNLSTDDINKYARNGWELMQVVPMHSYVHIFRREYVDKLNRKHPILEDTTPDTADYECLKKCYNMSLNNILNRKTFKKLERAGITRLVELCTKTESDLLSLYAFGSKSLKQVKTSLNEHKLCLGMVKPENVEST